MINDDYFIFTVAICFNRKTIFHVKMLYEFFRRKKNEKRWWREAGATRSSTSSINRYKYYFWLFIIFIFLSYKIWKLLLNRIPRAVYLKVIWKFNTITSQQFSRNTHDGEVLHRTDWLFLWMLLLKFYFHHGREWFPL